MLENRAITRIPRADKSDIEYKVITYPKVKQDMYIISNYGDVYNKYTGHKKAFYLDKDGYKKVNLSVDENTKNKRGRGNMNFGIHKLVAHEFIENEDPNKYNIVNHIDCKKDNNYYYYNLEYCDDNYNRKHAKQNLCMAIGERNPNSIFTSEDAIKACEFFQQGYKPVDILRIYGIMSTKSNQQLYDFLRNVYNRNTWCHISKDYIF